MLKFLINPQYLRSDEVEGCPRQLDGGNVTSGLYIVECSTMCRHSHNVSNLFVQLEAMKRVRLSLMQLLNNCTLDNTQQNTGHTDEHEDVTHLWTKL